MSSIESSPLGAWIRESEWGYPIVLICHTIGMALVVGGVMIFAIRVVCIKARPSIGWFALTFRVAWIGFAINLISGLILFSGAARRFTAHPAFQIKMASLAVGALLIWYLSRLIAAEAMSPATTTNSRTRWVAAVSVLCWFGAIAAGRLMAYIR